MTNQPLTTPISIRDVGLMVERGATYALAMKEFIDFLINEVERAGGRTDETLPLPVSSFDEEPPVLADEMARIHLAGMAEHLAMLAGVAAPVWCHDDIYFLKEPVFGGSLRNRDYMVVNTPSAFAKRSFFCGPVLSKLHDRIKRRYELHGSVSNQSVSPNI